MSAVLKEVKREYSHAEKFLDTETVPDSGLVILAVVHW